jgi:hypothetical protein
MVKLKVHLCCMSNGRRAGVGGGLFGNLQAGIVTLKVTAGQRQKGAPCGWVRGTRNPPAVTFLDVIHILLLHPGKRGPILVDPGKRGPSLHHAKRGPGLHPGERGPMSLALAVPPTGPAQIPVSGMQASYPIR